MKPLCKTASAFAACCLLTGPMAAQILNVEKSRLDHPEDKTWFGTLGVNFSYNNRSPNLQAPRRVLTAGGTTDVAFFAGDHLFMLINNYQLMLINDAPIINYGSSHLRTQFFHRDTLSYEVYGQYQYDQQRGLDYRFLSGAGPRWRLLKTSAWTFAVGTGLMFEAEDWRDPVTPEPAVVHARYLKSSSYFALRYAVTQKADFNSVFYYQVGYDRGYGDALHRVNGDINLVFHVFEKMAFTTSFSAAWESRPITPIIPFIFMVTNGIQYKF